MIDRIQALDFLNNKIANKNILKHMLATEALMGGVYDVLLGKDNASLGGTREEWMMAGLLHDGDYSKEVPFEKQGIQVTDWLKEKGFEIPENVVHAMAAHNFNNTKIEPKTKMDWTLFCGDSLTGLIVACALVMPSKKIADVTIESIEKKFKNKSFASGTRREEILMCEQKLNISLHDFIKICLSSMQNIHQDLGL